MIPDGKAGILTLAADGRATEFVREQFRHCKTILAIGSGSLLLEAAGIPDEALNKNGLILSEHFDKKTAENLIQELAQHRHFLRESDPPAV